MILTVILIGVMFSEPRATLGVFHNEKTQDIFVLKMIGAFFEMIPTFSFSLAFGLTSTIACNHIPFETNMWTPGRVYTWDDYIKWKIFRVKITNEAIDAPPV